MMANAGLDNIRKFRTTGSGHYWCAGAVTTWWKEAGLPTPPGAASCASWAAWGRKNGLFSSIPVVGAVVFYGNHVGIVAAISPKGVITTIEGNTGGGGFNRNGCGVFSKTPKRSRIQGFIIPPGCKTTR